MGGGGWKEIPEKYKPHWSVWKVDGTPLEETQHRLAKKGLKDPWIRNEVWQYRISDRFSNPIKVMRRGIVPGFFMFLAVLYVEKNYMTVPPSH